LIRAMSLSIYSFHSCARIRNSLLIPTGACVPVQPLLHGLYSWPAAPETVDIRVANAGGRNVFVDGLKSLSPSIMLGLQSNAITERNRLRKNGPIFEEQCLCR
jgi:hypothetical protein